MNTQHSGAAAVRFYKAVSSSKHDRSLSELNADEKIVVKRARLDDIDLVNSYNYELVEENMSVFMRDIQDQVRVLRNQVS